MHSNYCFKDSNSWGEYLCTLLADDDYARWPSAFAGKGTYRNIAGSITLYGRIVAVIERVDHCSITAIQQVPNLWGNVSQFFKIEYF